MKFSPCARRRLCALLSLAALVSTSCKGISKTGVVAKKEAGSLNDPGGKGAADLKRTGGPVEPPIPPGSSLMNAEYEVVARAIGIPACRGKVNLKINAVLKKADTTALFDLKSSKLDCVIIGELDISSILGAFSTAARPELVTKDGVIHLTRLGKGTYDPPRPFLPSFLASTPEELSNLDYSQKVTLTDTTKNVKAEGEFSITTVNGYPNTWYSDYLQRDFKKTILFDLYVTGFDNKEIDRPKHMLFDEMTFRMSLEPVAILQIYFKGPVKALADTARNDPAMSQSTMGQLLGIIPSDGLFGSIADSLMNLIQVEINLDLLKQEGLDQADEEDENDELFEAGRG